MARRSKRPIALLLVFLMLFTLLPTGAWATGDGQTSDQDAGVPASSDTDGISLTAEETRDAVTWAKTVTLTADGTGSVTVSGSGFAWSYQDAGDEGWTELPDATGSSYTVALAAGGQPIEERTYRCVYTYSPDGALEPVQYDAEAVVSLSTPSTAFTSTLWRTM